MLAAWPRCSVAAHGESRLAGPREKVPTQDSGPGPSAAACTCVGTVGLSLAVLRVLRVLRLPSARGRLRNDCFSVLHAQAAFSQAAAFAVRELQSPVHSIQYLVCMEDGQKPGFAGGHVCHRTGFLRCSIVKAADVQTRPSDKEIARDTAATPPARPEQREAGLGVEGTRFLQMRPLSRSSRRPSNRR